MNRRHIRRMRASLLAVLMVSFFPESAFSVPSRTAEDDVKGPLTAVHRIYQEILPEEETPQLRLLRSDRTVVEAELITAELQSRTELVEGVEYRHLSFPGATFTLEEGAPRLPVRVVTVGIPIEAEVRIEVVTAETERLSDVHVIPVPKRNLLQTPTGEYYTAEDFYRNEERYHRAALYPSPVVEMVQTAYIRDQRVAQVEIHPVQYNPVTGDLLFHRHIVFRLTFIGGESEKGWGSDQLSIEGRRDDPFEPVLKNILANYESSGAWRRQRSALPAPKAVSSETPYGDSTVYRISVSADGMHSMSYEYLQGKGVDVAGIDPRTVKLYNAGRQVPILVSGARDGDFDPGDVIQFWGELNPGHEYYYDLFTHTNIYWLAWGGDLGLRMVEQDGSPLVEDPDSLIIPRSYRATLHEERDLNYERLTQVNDEGIDRWLWDEIKADTTRDYPFGLTAVDDSAMIEVQVRLRGITFPPQRPNHHTKIWLNGNLLASEYWNDQSEYVFHRQDLPGTFLWEGNNLLRIANMGDTEAGDVDKVRLNWFQIDYWRKYQAEDNYLRFDSPHEGPLGLHEYSLTGFTDQDIQIFDLAGKRIVNYEMSPDSIFYKVKFQDRVVRPTQYVALSRSLMKLPDDVIQNRASDLHSTANGADYIIVVHSDFYESALPLATHRESQGLRVKVVLVEDIYDEFNEGVLSPLAIRDFLRYTYENWARPAPTYILLMGDTSWGYDKPLTHQSYWAEKCYVPTIMAWTSAWGMSASDNRLVCLVGDDHLPDMTVGRFPVSSVEETDIMVDKVIQYEADPDIGPWRKRIQLLAGTGTTFERGCVELDSAFVPPGYDVPRIYTESGSIHFGTTQDLLNQWNEGVALATFTGHGGGSVWFDANFFLLEHVPLLTNDRRLPVVLSLTCFVGYFDNPWYSSLGEEIVRAEDKGAVAHFGSSGVAWANEDNLLGQNIYQAMFEDGERSIGIVATQGKMGLRRISQELIDVFNLLGDPATQIGLPDSEISLDLSEHSLPIGEAIAVQGTIPGSPSGNVEVSFGDVDSTGWMVDTTEVVMVDKIYAPRIPLDDDTIAVSGGGFNWQVTPPDTMQDFPYYQPSSGRKAIRAYFWNGQTDAIGWAPIYLDIPFISNIHNQPEKPMAWDPVHIFADVDVGTGLDSDGPDTVKIVWGLREEMLFNHVLMAPESGNTFKTTSSLAAQGGAYIYYKILVKYGGTGGSPSTHTFTSSVNSFQVARLPNLWVARRSMSAFVQNDHFCVGSWVHNNGVIGLDSVLVRFFDDHPDSNRQINGDQRVNIPAEDSAFVSVQWEGLAGPHQVYVWVDPEGNVEQAPTFDDRAHRLFSNIFLVTPQSGTTVGGMNSLIRHTRGNTGCQITSGALNQSSLLRIGNQASDSTHLAQKHDPSQIYQPGLTFAALKDSTQEAYNFFLEDSTTALSSSGVSITFWYHPQDSLTDLAVGEGQLKICRFSEDIDRWILLSQQSVMAESSMVQAQTDQLGIFGLCIVDDQQAPMLRINVEGQSFANGDYISSSPIISAAIEDENGVDVSDQTVAVTLNGTPVSSGEYSMDYSPQTSNLSLVSYTPSLNPGSYTFKVTAQDCFGNATADSIFFNVTSGFQIPFVSNHPNPFEQETVFAFVVASNTPAEQVNLKIYTVRGRLIRQFQQRSVGPGYVEIVWDGRDSDGELVANGVYYYKLSVISGGGEKISPVVGKMAKLE